MVSGTLQHNWASSTPYEKSPRVMGWEEGETESVMGSRRSLHGEFVKTQIADRPPSPATPLSRMTQCRKRFKTTHLMRGTPVRLR